MARTCLSVLPGLAQLLGGENSQLLPYATRERSGGSTPLTQAAPLGAALIALHSFVDYPQRSTAIAALFGFLLAQMVGRPIEISPAQAP